MDVSFVRDDESPEAPMNREYDLFDRTGWEEVIFLLEEILEEGEAP